ncbi:MAG TPA: hypothetical protein VKV73_24640, partial [Chloroflexota bacterium]|nr:hypothetical protein [Chloroflexota bacterium]
IRADAHVSQPDARAESAEPAAATVEIRAADAVSLSRALAALRSTGVQVTVLSAVTHADAGALAPRR